MLHGRSADAEGKWETDMIERTTAIIAAALCASFIVVFAPGFAPEVAAGAANLRSSPALNAQQANAGQAGAAPRLRGGQRHGETACAESWPYYEVSCIRDDRQPDGRARAVRIVSIERTTQSGHGRSSR